MKPHKSKRNQIRKTMIKRINKTLWRFKIHHLIELERVIKNFYKEMNR